MGKLLKYLWVEVNAPTKLQARAVCARNDADMKTFKVKKVRGEKKYRATATILHQATEVPARFEVLFSGARALNPCFQDTKQIDIEIHYFEEGHSVTMHAFELEAFTG